MCEENDRLERVCFFAPDRTDSKKTNRSGFSWNAFGRMYLKMTSAFFDRSVCTACKASLLNICAVKERLILNIVVCLRESVVLSVIHLLRLQSKKLKQSPVIDRWPLILFEIFENHRRLLPLMFVKYKDNASTLDQALVMIFLCTYFYPLGNIL